MPIKMRDWDTCLGQGSPSLFALASVESLEGLLNLHPPSLMVLPTEKLKILHPAAPSLSFFFPGFRITIVGHCNMFGNCSVFIPIPVQAGEFCSSSKV